MNESKIGRVVRVNRGRFEVLCDEKILSAVLAGKCKYRDMVPVIGDWVGLRNVTDTDAIICDVKERTSYLSRPDGSGHADGFVKTVVEQAMVANLDVLFIFSALNNDFSVNRIVRFIATSLKGGCKPVVLLTKADLCPDKERYIDEVRKMNDSIDVFCISSLTGEGIDRVKSYVKPGITIGLMGSSGVGKSTLINTLAGKSIMKVSEAREKDAKGRHTTTHREMVIIDGTCFVDTPGMREFGICDVEEELNETFSDIAELTTGCRFRNCSHTGEAGCAVAAALSDGSLSGERWELYRKLLRESSKKKAMSASRKAAIQKIRAGL